MPTSIHSSTYLFHGTVFQRKWHVGRNDSTTSCGSIACRQPILILCRINMATRGSFTVKSVVCEMHPPLMLHRHPMCAEIIELFQKCHADHPVAKFFGECTDLKIKLDHCFREEKALKQKANFEESKKLKERLQAYRKATVENSSE